MIMSENKVIVEVRGRWRVVGDTGGHSYNGDTCEYVHIVRFVPFILLRGRC